MMVWIHGGGFTRGFSGTSSYNGEVLARKGAVIVTLNYRLGIFGFFAHPELSAESATMHQETTRCLIRSRRCSGCRRTSQPLAEIPPG